MPQYDHNLAHVAALIFWAATTSSPDSIIGQMQFDLFHAYTVDAHTTEVIANNYDSCAGLPDRFRCHPHRAALSATKTLYGCARPRYREGRGGDHSELGAVDAEQFCQDHGLSTVDTELVVWPVKNHLLMSQIAQRRDILIPRKSSNLRALRSICIWTICIRSPSQISPALT